MILPAIDGYFFGKDINNDTVTILVVGKVKDTVLDVAALSEGSNCGSGSGWKDCNEG